ncbi:MAG: HlyD family efflux transporter periplasmic adaptor subunit [Desulfobaccales bacterium]
MADKPPLSRTVDSLKSGDGGLAYLDQAWWRQLAEAASDEEFGHSWLVLQGRQIGGVRRGLVILGPPDTGPFAPVAVWPKGVQDIGSLAEVSERALKERKGVVTGKEPPDGASSSDVLTLQVAYPVRARGLLYGVAALEIDPRPHDELQSVMRQLQWGVAWLENWSLRKEAEHDGHTKQRLTAVLDLAATALEEEGFKAAATAFLTLLATRLSCDRVSLGFLKGKQVKVQALSHSAQFGKESNLIRAIGAAMDECIDQQKILVYPATSGNSEAILRAHAALALQDEDAAICSIPFLDKEGKGFGALTLERTADRPFDTATVELCDSVAALVTPILEEKRQNDRPLVKKIWEATILQAEKLVGPGHVAWKLSALALLILTVFLTLATGEYRVTANVTIEGAVQRAVLAPNKGYIYEAPVRAGDLVAEDQVMCRLDDRDLRLERLKYIAQRQQALLRYREAMADADPAKMNQFREQMRQAEVQLALIEEELTRANILAPFRGVVVKGDLSQSLGAPVERGQVLFEVAPLDAYRVKLQVDDSDINYIKVGQKGAMVLTALPDASLPFVVNKITPVTTAKEGRNFFLVEAGLEQALERLRPGMEGYAKVMAGRYRLFWIWTHSLIDWMRLKVWSWWP